MNIHVPSAPKRLKITQAMIEDCLIDPVFAAQAIFKVKLDAFQRSRLKLSWWVPFVMDSSGYGSAKTINLFWTSVLRCILIPDHHAAVYYPSFGTMQQVFWPYFSRFAARSELFRHQVGKRKVIGLDGVEEDEGKGAYKGGSCYVVEFRNASKIIMPAGNFMQDAKGQAGQRFNFLGIDEWGKIDSTGSTGINDQLIGRTNRESFNQNHPLWCNHQMFTGTAEDASHPSYKRFMEYSDEVNRGNPNYAILQYSYKDWSDLPYTQGKSFREKLRDDANVKMMRKGGRTKILTELLGVWLKNGKGLYTKDLIDAAHRLGAARKLEPMTGQHHDPVRDAVGKLKVFYFLGVDPAKADNKKSDDGAIVCLRAELLKDDPRDMRDFKLDFVWAYQVRRAAAHEWSGIIHRKNLHFGFSGIVMDPNGGGQWIRPELAKQEQELADQKFKTRAIGCLEDEPRLPMSSQFILSMFSWGESRIKELWNEAPKHHEDNLYDLAHSEFHEAFHQGCIGLPCRLKDRGPSETEGWSEEQNWANQLIEKMGKQLTKVYVLQNEDGTTSYSLHGARLYSAKGMKDFAYAGMYAYIAFRIWLKLSDDRPDVSEENAELCG